MDGGIEVDNGVKMSGSTNPCVHSLPVGLVPRVRVIVVVALVGRDCRAVDADAMRVGAGDDLLIGRENASHKGRVFGLRSLVLNRQPAEVVDAFEDNQPFHAGLRQHIAVKAGQRVGAESVGKQMIAANTLIGNADGVRSRVGLQTGVPARQASGHCRW